MKLFILLMFFVCLNYSNMIYKKYFLGFFVCFFKASNLLL